jgi:hypothetical protein
MKRKVPKFRVNLGPGASYDMLTEVPEVIQIVIDETVVAIKEGITKNKKSINLFEISNSDFYIELKKDQWKTSLEKALEYYIEKEEYEMCAECRDLINKL